MVQRRIVTKIVSMFKSIPLGSPNPLVYNIKPFCLLVLLVYNINNRSMSSMFKSIPLGSPIPLVYNIKPLGLLVLLVYNMNNRSMPSMIKCHIQTNIVSI